jgi:histidinol-phosphatase
VGSRADDLELALELADLADSMTLGRFHAEDLVVEQKPDLTPVTEADRAVERMIREALAQARPGDVVAG